MASKRIEPAVGNPVGVPPAQRREPRMETLRRQGNRTHADVDGEHPIESPNEIIEFQLDARSGREIDVGHLSTGMHASIGTTGDRDERRHREAQHGGEGRLKQTLHGAKSGLASPPEERAAVIAEVESQPYSPSDRRQHGVGAELSEPGRPSVGVAGLVVLGRAQAFSSSAGKSSSSAGESSASGAGTSSIASASATSSVMFVGSSVMFVASVSAASVTSATSGASSTGSATAALAGEAAAVLAARSLAPRLVAPVASATTFSASASTSSISAIGALSPLRGPSLTMRV